MEGFKVCVYTYVSMNILLLYYIKGINLKIILIYK